MKLRVQAAVVTATLWAGITLGASAPALADGAASTRNIIILGAATASIPLIVNYNHKVRAKRAEQQEVARRQDAYRDWFYHKYGYYPTDDQFKQWYVQTYGASPSATQTQTTQGAQPAAAPAQPAPAQPGSGQSPQH
jgi:hypothetical protein